MTAFGDRIDELVDRARRDRAAFEPPAEPPDEDAALEYLIEGAGVAVGLYIEARTGDMVRFDEDEFARLERALNDWLELYAACYGVELETAFSVREAAEVLIETQNIRDAATLLTQIPDRDAAQQWDQPGQSDT